MEQCGTEWNGSRNGTVQAKKNGTVKWTERDGPQTNRAGLKGPVFNRHWTVPYRPFIKIPFDYCSLKNDRYLNGIEPFRTVPWLKRSVFERDEHRSIIAPWTVPLTKRNSIGTVQYRSNPGPLKSETGWAQNYRNGQRNGTGWAKNDRNGQRNGTVRTKNENRRSLVYTRIQISIIITLSYFSTSHSTRFPPVIPFLPLISTLTSFHDWGLVTRWAQLLFTSLTPISPARQNI